MKYSNVNEIPEGSWCRLADGSVCTWVDPEIALAPRKSYFQALIDMGAEWYPPIHEGYRLATEEDRKGPKPKEYKCCPVSGYEWYGGSAHEDKWWDEGCEYIVPKAKPQADAPAKKVYTVGSWLGPAVVLESRDFQPGDKVTIEKVSE